MMLNCTVAIRLSIVETFLPFDLDAVPCSSQYVNVVKSSSLLIGRQINHLMF